MLTLLRRLLSDTPHPLAPDDARLALAALMVRLARSDGHYDARESALIASVLMDRYALGHQAAQALRAEAESIEAEAPDTVRFTRAIKQAVPYEDRERVVEALWQIALADGHRDDAESGLMRLVVNLLGVNDRNSALARQRIEARKT
ncbi:MAG: TerB family tellurite resistance protein [Paracoccaceae bacterium]